MRKIAIHWERLSLGTLLDLHAAQQCADPIEQMRLIFRVIDPLINGRPLAERSVAEAKAIFDVFASEGATKILEAMAIFRWAMGMPPALPAPAAVKDTATYTAQPGEGTEN